jgi:hypothetical protein
MNQFSSAREAKEFLVSRIVEEAQREGVPLSEVERKMLYFTETGWTLPNILDVSDEFDRDYDQDEYEKKIASLIKNAVKQKRKSNPVDYASWQDAIGLLNTEDHYILAMVQRAGLAIPSTRRVRPSHDRLKLWGTGFAIVGSFLCVVFLALKYNVDPHVAIVATALGLAAAYVLFRLIYGASRTDKLVVRFLGDLFGYSGKNE